MYKIFLNKLTLFEFVYELNKYKFEPIEPKLDLSLN